MNYRSFSDLNLAVKKWIPELPDDIGLVVGVPRSGMLVATLLALYLNVPLTDIDGLCENRIFRSGERLNSIRISHLSKKKVLIVDDSVASGTQMRKIKQIIKKHKISRTIYYAAAYITPEGSRCVDYYYQIVDPPRIFEWNIMHHSILRASCVDLDGVLCQDPTEKENDDGQKYLNFIRSARALFVPSQTIGYIVTGRLEKYRKATQEWLKRHNIHYSHLIMLNVPDKITRHALGIPVFKAKIYKMTNADLFIESSLSQAIKIAKMSGRPVLCTETWELINSNKAIGLYTRNASLLKKFKEKFRKNPQLAVWSAVNFLFTKLRSEWLKLRIGLRRKNHI